MRRGACYKIHVNQISKQVHTRTWSPLPNLPAKPTSRLLAIVTVGKNTRYQVTAGK